MKKTYLFWFMILTVLMLVPVRSQALTVTHKLSYNNSGADYGLDNSGYESECVGNDSILGDPNDEDSVAWLIHKILSYVTIVGMILVVVLSSIDFFKVIIKNDNESINKAAKKFGLRLIFAAFLFFTPTITNALLSIFGLTSASTCGIQQ